MLKKEADILSPFAEKPWAKATFKEVMNSTKKTSESYVFGSLKRLVKEGILKEERVGKAILYSLNLEHGPARAYAGMVKEHIAWHAKQLPLEDLNELAGKIQTSLFVFLVTGSYARNTQREDSDIDIVVIAEDTKRVYAQLRFPSEMHIPPFHPYAFTPKEFLLMLADDKENYGKEFARNNLIIYGADAYYRMLWEAIRHGFNG
ncbi:MAG: nucleotidyltransferase domain-containing protein [Nanoarchaeota archaeon]